MKVTVTTASTLIGSSRRTIGRKLDRTEEGMVEFESLRTQLVVAISPSDEDLVVRADQGVAEAQNDLALLFLEAGRYEEAVHWLQRAARQELPDAMHWLARCYLSGDGISQNVDLGMMWLHKAAAAGHAISKAQTLSLLQR